MHFSLFQCTYGVVWCAGFLAQRTAMCALPSILYTNQCNENHMFCNTMCKYNIYWAQSISYQHINERTNLLCQVVQMFNLWIAKVVKSVDVRGQYQQIGYNQSTSILSITTIICEHSCSINFKFILEFLQVQVISQYNQHKLTSDLSKHKISCAAKPTVINVTINAGIRRFRPFLIVEYCISVSTANPPHPICANANNHLTYQNQYMFSGVN